jgi:MOSC domain-containing protein YiiM
VAGRVEAIRIAPAAGAPMQTVWRIAAHAGRGLEGDRYHLGTGDGSARGGSGRGLTLVSADAVEQANREHPDLAMTPALTRRNVTVRGVDLDALIGREFRIGRVRCLGVRRAEPCTYLEGLVGRPVREALVHRAGLRADILEDGEIAVGDEVTEA